VRRLGLSEDAWESVSPRGEGRMYAEERHITSVRMSRDKADEVGSATWGIIKLIMSR